MPIRITTLRRNVERLAPWFEFVFVKSATTGVWQDDLFEAVVEDKKFEEFSNDGAVVLVKHEICVNGAYVAAWKNEGWRKDGSVETVDNGGPDRKAGDDQD